jgi:hypothetical protein
MPEPLAFSWPDRTAAVAELDSDLAAFNAVIPGLDATLSAEVTRLEAVVQDLLAIGKADMAVHPFDAARAYAALKSQAGPVSESGRTYGMGRSDRSIRSALSSHPG